MNSIDHSDPSDRSCVAIVRCPSYNEPTVDAALARGIELLGGIGRFCSPGDRILLKPNLLAAEPAEKMVTTHPAVFAAAARLFSAAGAHLAWGDSPGFGSMVSVGRKAGIVAAGRRLGLAEADFETAVEVSAPAAKLARKMELAKGALETDGIVSLAKLKTHGLTRITGAVKNTFGCVPGIRKGEFHVKMPRIDHFSDMLVDICRYLKPRLHIMDGIVAMEGNGPRAGMLYPLQCLILSADPVSVDAAVCRLIHLPPEYVPTMKPGQEAGLGEYSCDRIDWLGDPVEDLHAPRFQVVRKPADDAAGTFPVFLKNWVAPRPEIDYDICLNCGACVDICPVRPRAVDWHDRKQNDKPTYLYSRCIRCYCCQEICPHRAIRIHTPLLGHIIHRG